MPKTHQLAAILFADIVGYSAIMQEDEHKAILFRDKLRKSLESEVILRGGRVLKYTGDGALCSFDSAVGSIRAAMAVQLTMQEEPRVPLRIGIHQADVIFEDSDVYGDGVNVAARLESLSIPGGIFISAKVFDDIKNQTDIKTVSLGRYLLKNIKEPVQIYAISNPGIRVPVKKRLEGKGVKYSRLTDLKNRKVFLTRILLPLMLAGAVGVILIPPVLKRQQIRNETLPAIQKLVNENFIPPIEAFDLALEAEKILPNDSALIRLWPVLSTTVSCETQPAGVEVYWKDYQLPDAPWRRAGTTPLDQVKFPRGYLRMEFRKNGFQTIEYAGPWSYGRLGPDILFLKMDSLGSLPEHMVRIPKDIPLMYIVGLEQHGGKEVGEFLMDKYEVTNAQYKKFIDGEGYNNPSFWIYPIHSNGKELNWKEAMALFTDRTGRPGPAGWEAGSYPDGLEDHPVTGISWYEAAAYATYAGKQLPTIYHWGRVAETSRTQFIVPFSNYNGKSTTAVGTMPGYSSFGIYDLAGNAREWCFNENNIPGQRYILGGGWNDPTYAFNDGYTQPAMDRSISNGFRCIRELPGDTTLAHLKQMAPVAFRDYRKEKPVDDKTFQIFLNQFAYDNKPLEARVENKIDNEFWQAEKISFDAGYNGERMEAYLYLPKQGSPPYQTVLFFPGSGDIFSRKYDPESINVRVDFILKSGRALARPIYKGTHERHDELKSDLQEETVFYKDHVIMWRKEIGRTIDYLETRKDIQSDKLAYLGWSWGGFLGGIMPAVEQRIKVVVLNVGGMIMTRAMPEVDQINFLPRVKQPVLMLNGKHDMFFPVETSQKPMFDFLGTPKDDKKIIIYESGHLVPRTEFVKETLLWYDKYLGKVK